MNKEFDETVKTTEWFKIINKYSFDMLVSGTTSNRNLILSILNNVEYNKINIDGEYNSIRVILESIYKNLVMVEESEDGNTFILGNDNYFYKFNLFEVNESYSILERTITDKEHNIISTAKIFNTQDGSIKMKEVKFYEDEGWYLFTYNDNDNGYAIIHYESNLELGPKIIDTYGNQVFNVFILPGTESYNLFSLPNGVTRVTDDEQLKFGKFLHKVYSEPYDATYANTGELVSYISSKNNILNSHTHTLVYGRYDTVILKITGKL